MNALLASIVNGLFGTALNFLKGWWDAEKAKQQEFENISLKEKLESVREAEKVVAEIREEQQKVIPISKEEWNKGLLVLLCVSLLTLSSCYRTVYVNREMPVLPVPQRPTLVDSDKRNVESLILYATKLEVTIKKYNEFALSINKKQE